MTPIDLQSLASAESRLGPLGGRSLALALDARYLTASTLFAIAGDLRAFARKDGKEADCLGLADAIESLLRERHAEGRRRGAISW